MRKHNLKMLLALGAVAMLAGCAAPSVKYVNVTADMRTDVADIYALNAAKLTITPPAPKPAPPPAGTGTAKASDATAASQEPSQSGSLMTMSVSAIADQSRRIGVDPTKNVWSSTKVNIEKVANTERVANIGVETTDNAKTFITTVGGLIVKALTFAAPTVASAAVDAPAPEEKCVFIPEKGATSYALPGSTIKEATGVVKAKTGGGNSCFQISYGAVPAEAIPFEKLPIETKSEHYYFSACRELTVSLTTSDGTSVTEAFRVPDSNWLQKVAFPYTGSIAMHSVCGVSVTTTAQANPMAPYEFATELLKQAELIRKANDGK